MALLLKKACCSVWDDFYRESGRLAVLDQGHCKAIRTTFLLSRPHLLARASWAGGNASMCSSLA